jgi:LmbE family N-acetylglucosaminyl deacetylase
LKHFTIFALLAVVLLLSSFLFFKKETVVFYSPHADDEVLSMGASIIKEVKKGNEVYVVLLSQGLASSAINKVNAKLESEGYQPIKVEEFGEARIEEFKNSVTSMGVPENHIIIKNLPDGEFTSELVKEVIQEMEKKYIGAKHHVMSDQDPHADHASTGIALRELTSEGITEQGYYHIPIQEFENLSYSKKVKMRFGSKKTYQKALNAYGIWKPEEGKYSIGLISVTDYFSSATSYMESRWHR